MKNTFLKILLILVAFVSLNEARGQAPEIQTYSPVPGATGVSVNSVLTLTFDQSVIFNSSGEYYIEVYNSGGLFKDFAIIDGSPDAGVSISGSSLFIDCPADFIANASYYVKINSGAILAQDDSSVFGGIVSNSQWSFTIIGPTSPLVLSLDPIKDDSNIPTDKILSITFDQNVKVNPTSTSKYIRVFKNGGVEVMNFRLRSGGLPTATPAGCVMQIVNNVVTLDYNGLYENGASYYVTIDAGALVGTDGGLSYLGIDNSISNNWRFSIVAAPPSISTYSPTQGAIDIGSSQALILTFNENISLGTSGLLRIKKYADDGSFDLFDNSSSSISVTGAILTIYPHSEFAEDTKYYVTIEAGFIKSAVSGANFGGISDKNQWSFTSEKVRTWIGGSSSSWTDDGNWDKPYSNGATVKIPGTGSYQPVLSSAASVKDLIIEAAGALNVASTGSLTISGKLELKSLATDNADLAIEGSVSVSPSNVYIRQAVSATGRSYNLSSPVSGATMTNIGGNFQMYKWDGSTGLWSLENAATAMETARGYVLRQSVTYPSLVFSGALNTGTVVANAYLTASNSAGWNLIGNPFPCTINFSSVTKSANLEPSFWIYQNLDNLYGAYNTSIGVGTLLPNALIPSNTAFWVKVKQGTTIPSTETVTMDNSCHQNVNISNPSSHNSYLKSASYRPDYPKMKLALTSGIVTDEIAIAFAEEATDNVESYDCLKYFATNNQVAQPFMPVGDKSLAINSLSFFTGTKTVPVSLKVPVVGNYTFDRGIVEFIDDAVGIYLDDTKTNTITDLRTTPNYPFSIEAADIDANGINSGRFQVRFVGSIVTSTKNDTEASDIAVSTQGSDIYIEHAGVVSGKSEVFDMNGVLIKDCKLNSSGTTHVSLSQQGLYVVKVTYIDGVESFKVLISK